MRKSQQRGAPKHNPTERKLRMLRHTAVRVHLHCSQFPFLGKVERREQPMFTVLLSKAFSISGQFLIYKAGTFATWR